MAYLGRRRIIGFALFGLLLVAVAVAVAGGSEGTSESELPDGCDVLYKTLSPDGRFLAYVGEYTDDTGTKQYGLFVVENGSRKVRRLLETAVKTVPAWSPDSRRLAIGNSPGYGNRYPLVIVDVQSSEVSETGVQGVGAAWSPDGRFIAVSTEIVRGGNWSHGIPIDGRIGVWDVEKKKLSPVTPPGYNIEDDIGGNYGMGGSFDPVWSPDGRWIAYRRITVFIEGKRDERSDEIWIADREGREFRKAFEGSKKVCWSADGKSLSVAGGDPPQQVELSRLESVAVAAMPGPPPALVEAAQRAAAAIARAESFDADPLLRRNRLWQNPELGHLQSVEFTHHMEPIVLDERFVWRSDGASLMEVVARDDDKAAKEVGRRVITTPAAMKYYRAPGAKYYTGSAIGESGLNNYVRSHLMGTQTNFTALDWGRNPGGFAVRDVQPGSDKDTVVVDLKPTVRRYRINFGAMFHTTSWAYMHDLRVGHSEITVDVRNHRILSEVDYNYQGGKICQVDFLDWQDVDSEHSVPKHIHIDIPGSNFEVDYRFQWLPEKLWILSSGQACFNKKNPQCEELRDLKINQPTPDLDAALAEVAQNQKELEGGDAIQPEKRFFALYPFQLGKRMRRDVGTAKAAEPCVREVFFTIGEQNNLLIRFDVAGIDEKDQAKEYGNDPHRLFLVLFDKSGQPVSTYHVPLTSALLRRSAGIWDDIRAHNQIWLAPGIDALPEVTYVHKKLPSRRFSTHGGDSDSQRGVTLTLGLDTFMKSAGEYRVPLLFAGVWEQREVIVMAVSGPEFPLIWGDGISGSEYDYPTGKGKHSVASSWYAYRCGRDKHGLLVIDKETSRPLLARYGDVEIRFLDYIEVRPGQYAPLRIAILDRQSRYDFSFQIIDGKVWLFDRSYIADGTPRSIVEDVLIGENKPAELRRREGNLAPIGQFEPFDWSKISNRRSLQDSNDPLIEEIIQTARPFEHKSFAALLDAQAVADQTDGIWQITMDLGKSRVLSMVKFWSVGGLGHVPPPTGTEKLEAAVWPCRYGEKLIVDVPAQAKGFGPYVDASGKTRIRSVRLQKDESGDLAANLEIVSRDHLKELNGVAAVVLLDENYSVVAAATGDLTFQVRGEIYNSSDFVLKLGRPPQTQSPKYLLLGLKTIHIGGPMGSLWGRYYGRSPLFSFEQMLAAEDARVWAQGLRLLDEHLHREVIRREVMLKEYGKPSEPTRNSTLRPHLQRFEHFFKVDEDAEALAVLCRLAGHSGDKRFVAIMLPLLQHKSETVQDAAAIGLGLLGNSAGRNRLELIQNLPSPTDRDKYAAVGYWKMDADFAMKEIEKSK